MYLLYLDESGNERDPNDTHFVLAGLPLMDRQPHWLASRLEKIQTRTEFQAAPPL